MRTIPNPHNPSLFFLAALSLASLTIYAGGSVGNNGVQLNIGLSQGESDYSKSFYTNSQIVAENGTLTHFSTQPLTFDWAMSLAGKGNPKEDYHFTTPQRREEMRRDAYESGNLELFGQYLHAFQDSFSHQNENVSPTWERKVFDFLSSKPQQKNTPYPASTGHLFDEDFPDRTFNRPELADKMAKSTYDEMQKFIQYRNSQVPNSFQQIINNSTQMTPINRPINTYNKISNEVQQFNRLKEEDNNAKGQSLFK